MTASARLGKNRGGYGGERIDIQEVLRDVRTLAQQHVWQIEELPASTAPTLVTLHRFAPSALRRVYLSAGIHGDEPAGPLALRQLLQENVWPADASIWLCPCLNPTGFARHTRENADGIDLNRDYRTPSTAEVRAHVRWLEQQPRFDLTLCLHEDWEAEGFYVYDRNLSNGRSIAPAVIKAVAEICPIDLSPRIDGWPAREGVIRANDDPSSRPLWAEAVYLTTVKTDYSCTLEAPSDFPLATRVAALVRGVRAAFEVTSCA